MPEHILVEQIDKIGKVTFTREKVLNALMPGLMQEVIEAVADLEQNPDVRVIVFTGRGRAFSSGADMTFLDELTKMKPNEIKNTVYTYFGGGIKAVKLCSKPTIASVNGMALGAGCEFALACDFRIASEKAAFSELWIKVGVIPPLGGMFLLPRLVGLSKATEMIMLGTRVEGHEAERIGLVNKVVPADQLEAETMKLARELADGPHLAYKVAKEGLRRGMESTLAAEWEFNFHAQSLLLDTDDFAEAVRAFQEKRSPKFQGR
jgi:enoyl-CoA hydratase/carnithine racemase